MRTITLVALGAAVACGSDGSGPSDPVFPPPPEHDFAPLTAAIQTALDANDHADSAALILIQNNRVVYERGFGSMTPDTEVTIASAAKWLTATTILSAVHRGDIALDDRVEPHLPAEFFLGKGDGNKEEITFRHLISLMSGIPTHHQCMYRTQRTLQTCAIDIGGRSLLVRPGGGFVYSQAAFAVAGAALENATGRSWEENFDRNIRRPLGMNRTQYLGADWENPQLGDGATSSVRDYARMVQMIFNGGTLDGVRVLSLDLVKQMLSDQSGGAPIVFTPRAPSMRYGLGVWRDRVDPATGAALLVSSPGSTGFVPWIDFERNLIGVLAVPPHLTFTSPLWGEVWRTVESIVPPVDLDGTGDA